VKAAELPDETFLAAIDEANRRRGFASASRWDVACVLAGHPEAVGTADAARGWPSMPAKLVVAKARRLVHKRLINGCCCGCRGGFEITEKGRQRQQGAAHGTEKGTE
jgi:hypothetical protein